MKGEVCALRGGSRTIVVTVNLLSSHIYYLFLVYRAGFKKMVDE